MTQKQKPKLDPKWIDHHAFKIVKSLQDQGFTTYLVGGCVRDLLLGISPKDYDIATDARPADVRRHVQQAYIIGKRFRLVLVKRYEKQFEVATFRRNVNEDDILEEVPDGDNLFGTPEEDAHRRDFTINGLFYDPVSNEVIDFLSGRQDLNSGVIKMIGEPNQRLQEDPIRILRAIRLAHKIRFSLDTELRKAIQDKASQLATSALPRRREELLKFLRLPEPILPLLDCYDLGVLEFVSPTLHKVLANPESHDVFIRYMQNFHDLSVNTESPVDMYAVLVLALMRSFIQPDPRQPVRAKDLLEDPQLKSFMRDEMGMFNYEQAFVTKALQLQSLLSEPEEFAKRGEKRQLATMRAEAFPLALRMAQRDYSLSSETLHFWLNKYEELSPLLAELNQNKERRKRPRRRKRRPSKQ